MEVLMKGKCLFAIAAMLLTLTDSLSAQVSWQFANGPWYANIENFGGE